MTLKLQLILYLNCVTISSNIAVSVYIKGQFCSSYLMFVKSFLSGCPQTQLSTLYFTRWRSWQCVTGREVAVSIPTGVIGIFHSHNPSGRTMALGSTQPLTEMSTRKISWTVKAASAYGWQPYHLHVPTVLKSGSLNLLETSGPVMACNGIALPF